MAYDEDRIANGERAKKFKTLLPVIKDLKRRIVATDFVKAGPFCDAIAGVIVNMGESKIETSTKNLNILKDTMDALQLSFERETVLHEASDDVASTISIIEKRISRQS